MYGKVEIDTHVHGAHTFHSTCCVAENKRGTSSRSTVWGQTLEMCGEWRVFSMHFQLFVPNLL